MFETKNKKLRIVLECICMPIFLACISFTLIYTVLSVKIVSPKLALDTVRTVFGGNGIFEFPNRQDIYNKEDDPNPSGGYVRIEDIEYPHFNTVFGELEIPKIERTLNLIMGESEQSITDGAAMFTSSYIPGYGGTTLVTTHNNNVVRLDRLEAGDEIIIRTNYGTYKYAVREISIVSKDDREAFKVSQTGNELVFFTCYPLRKPSNAAQRMVVYADLVSGPGIVR